MSEEKVIAKVVYLPLSQYTLNCMKTKDEGEQPISKDVFRILDYMDRFSRDTLESLEELFGVQAVEDLITTMDNLFLLKAIPCETGDDEKEICLVITEYLGSELDNIAICSGTYNEVGYEVPYIEDVCVEALDHFVQRDVAFEYEVHAEKRHIIEDLTLRLERLYKKQDELIYRLKQKVELEKELVSLKAQVKTKTQIESLYGRVDVEYILLQLQLLTDTILKHKVPKDSEEPDEAVVELNVVEEGEDKLDKLIQNLEEAAIESDEELLPADYFEGDEDEEETTEEDDFEEEGEDEDSDIEDDDDEDSDFILTTTKYTSDPDDDDLEENSTVTVQSEPEVDNSDVPSDLKDRIKAIIETMSNNNSSKLKLVETDKSKRRALSKALLVLKKIEAELEATELTTNDILDAIEWGVQDESFWKQQLLSFRSLAKISASNDNPKYANLYNSYERHLEKQTAPKDEELEELVNAFNTEV